MISVKQFVRLEETEMRKNNLIEASYRESSNEFFFVIDKTNYEQSTRHYWNGILKQLKNNGVEACVSDDKLWKKMVKLDGWELVC